MKISAYKDEKGRPRVKLSTEKGYLVGKFKTEDAANIFIESIYVSAADLGCGYVVTNKKERKENV